MSKDSVVTDVWSLDSGNAAVDSCPLVVGLDLGTSNSCMAIWHLDKNIVKVFKSRSGERTTPSVVRWDPGADPAGSPQQVGKAALEDAPEGSCTVRCVKRIIGQSWDSPKVQALLHSLPFNCVAVGQDAASENAEEDDDGDGVMVVGGEVAGIEVAVASCEAASEVKGGNNKDDDRSERRAVVRPEAVSAAVVGELKKRAEAYLTRTDHRHFKLMAAAAAASDESVFQLTKCVVGVPVYFTERQRRATREACHQAGFRQVSLLAESTAAAVAYGLFVVGSKTVLVFDCGGGTTDVTLLRIDEGKFQVLATAGDNRLGGEDMDMAMARLVLRKHDAAVAGGSAAAAAAGSGAPAAAELGSSLKATTTDDKDADFDLRLSSDSLRAACTLARVQLSTQPSARVHCAGVRASVTRAGGSVASDGSEGEAAAGANVDVDVEVSVGEYEVEVAALVLKAKKLVESVLRSSLASSASTAATSADSSSSEAAAGETSAAAVAAAAAVAGVAVAGGAAAAGAAAAAGVAVDEVVLVGGASRTPCLRAMLKRAFPHLKDLCTSSDADTSVAEGLAIRGAVASLAVKPDVLSKFLMTDILPLDIGVECFDDDDDDHDDHELGGGAASAAAADGGGGGDKRADDDDGEGEREEGEEAGRGRGRIDVVLAKHTRLPATNTRVFRCADPNQGGVTVDVYEGSQHGLARDNDRVASFTFLLPKRRPRQRQQEQERDAQLCGERRGVVEGQEQESGGDGDDGSAEGDDYREILVRFIMTEGGELRVTMLDDDYRSNALTTATTEEGGAQGRVTEEEAQVQRVLTCAVAVLAFLYLLLRLAVRPVFEHGDALAGSGAEEITAAVRGAVFGGGRSGGGSGGDLFESPGAILAPETTEL